MRGVALVALAAGIVAPTIASAAAGDFLVRVRGIGVLPDVSAKVAAPVGGSVKIDDTFVPEVDFSYFFTGSISAELIAATSKHKATSTVAGPLGSVWVLPPTLLLQYHFDHDGLVSPYVGAGINYTLFYNRKNPPGGLRLHYPDSVGPAIQFGADVKLDKNWVFNIDVKKIWMETDVTINPGAIKAKVNVDPWVVGTGIGYRF